MCYLIDFSTTAKMMTKPIKLFKSIMLCHEHSLSARQPLDLFGFSLVLINKFSYVISCQYNKRTEKYFPTLLLY